MLADQCISITDLKKNMNAYVKDLWKEKIIFVKNKPVAVLMDINKYEKLIWNDSIFDVTFNHPIPPKKILNAYRKKYGWKKYGW